MFQIDDGAGCAIAQAHQPLIVEEGLALRSHHICGTLVEGSSSYYRRQHSLKMVTRKVSTDVFSSNNHVMTPGGESG